MGQTHFCLANASLCGCNIDPSGLDLILDLENAMLHGFCIG